MLNQITHTLPVSLQARGFWNRGLEHSEVGKLSFFSPLGRRPLQKNGATENVLCLKWVSFPPSSLSAPLPHVHGARRYARVSL